MIMKRVSIMLAILNLCQATLEVALEEQEPTYVEEFFNANETLKAASGYENSARDVIYLTNNYLVSGPLVDRKDKTKTIIADVRDLNLATVLNIGDQGVVGIQNNDSQRFINTVLKFSIFSKNLSLEATDIHLDKYIEVDWSRIKIESPHKILKDEPLRFILRGKHKIYQIDIKKRYQGVSFQYSATLNNTLDWVCGADGSSIDNLEFTISNFHSGKPGIAICHSKHFALFDVSTFKLISQTYYSPSITKHITYAGANENWILIVERFVFYSTHRIGSYSFKVNEGIISRDTELVLENKSKEPIGIYGISMTGFAIMYSKINYHMDNSTSQYSLCLDFLIIGDSGTLTIPSAYSVNLQHKIKLNRTLSVNLFYIQNFMKVVQLQQGSNNFIVINTPSSLKDLAIICYDNLGEHQRCTLCLNGVKGSCISCKSPYH